ncbi:MAG: hybrid sensor histidine kinase/response regulator [Anaerolineales bacterium]|nr:hybrid sensor histidine kinase/response regulator [Anaerolineales bacterium]
MSVAAKVLYIEDDTDSRRLVARVLRGSGYEVFLAADGLEGVTLAQSVQPQLVLMDINLPNMDGRAVTTRLRSLPHLETIPIVALTANHTSGNRELALAAGCTGFLTKPIDVDALPDDVDAFLHGRQHLLRDDERYDQLERHAKLVVGQLEDKIRELEISNQRLYHLDRLKSDFIILASHELRTPLTLVIGYAQLLEMQLQQLQEKDEAGTVEWERPLLSVAKLNRGMMRLSQVVDEIIGISRIAANRLDLHPQTLSLAAMVDQVVAEFAPVCAERNLKIVVRDLEKLPPVQADREHLQTAVANVIENALKFTPNDRSIYISGHAEESAVVLDVQDTGIGIALEDQPYIFDQFYVVGSIDHHSSSKSSFLGGGLGIGLAVARGIVQAHNGRIWVESPGQDFNTLPGSTFHILLPRTIS